MDAQRRRGEFFDYQAEASMLLLLVEFVPHYMYLIL